MAALLDVVREWEQELRNGIAWVAFWKEGPSWDAQCVYLDDKDLLVDEDTSALEEAIQKDPHAVVLNSYYCGQIAEDMTVNELAAGVRHHYEQGTNSVVDFLFEHKNLMSNLYEKVSKEQEQYESWLLNQKPSVILDHSYDYVVREDIVAVIGDGDFVLGNSQAMALLSFPDTLSYLQNEYERSDPNTLGRTWEIVEATALQTDAYLGHVVGVIGDFYKKNYHREADFSELEKVSLVDTTIFSNKVHLQVIADLVNFRIDRYVEGKPFDGRQYTSLKGMYCDGLQDLTVEELVDIPESELISSGVLQEEKHTVTSENPQENVDADLAAPNVSAYQELKSHHPGKVAGVQVGECMTFYGEDARTVAPALRSKLLLVDIPGMGRTEVTGSSLAWQSVFQRLVEHNIPVVLAKQEPEQGRDAPYRVIKEREKVAADGRGYDIPPEADSFSIYQMKQGPDTLMYAFQSYDKLQNDGLSVEFSHYERVYTGPLHEGETLDDLYAEFNLAIPDDFWGHSMSVSDVVVLHQNGEDTAYYCDMVGFREVPEFLEGEVDRPEQEEEMEL